MSDTLKQSKHEIKSHFNETHSRSFYENYFTELKPDGERLKAVCPFCDDKTPSFKIYKDGGFKCYQCGKSGDIFTFYAEHNGLTCEGSDFVKVLEGIVNEFGLGIEVDTGSEIDYIPEKVVTNLHNNLLGNQAKMSFLTDYRGLNPSIIKRFKLGYDGERITIPIQSRAGKYVDIRRYDSKSKAKYLPWKTADQAEHEGNPSSQIYPIKNLNNQEILICEGELDNLRAIAEGFNAVTNTCGVQGWKDKWNRYLRGKDIILALDNDSAGRKETERRAKKLTDVKSLKIVAWPESFQEGGDVTDFLNKYTATDFKDLFKTTRKGYGVTPISLKEGKEIFHKWLEIEDDSFIDAVLGAHLTTKILGDPVWLFLIAPPGSGKTELLRTLDSKDDVYSTSSITDKTLVSGANKEQEVSLAPKLDGKTFIIKDFSPILSIKYEQRSAIFNDLRDCYDGYIEKDFGNQAEKKSFETHFSLIAGVTPVIDKHSAIEASLGERFLKLRIDISKRTTKESIVKAAMDNVDVQAQMRKELKQAIKQTLAGVDLSYEVKFDDYIQKQIQFMALFLAYSRTAVEKDPYDNTLKYLPESESGARPAIQLKKLAIGICWLRGIKEPDEAVLHILRRVTVGSMPRKRAKVLFAIAEADNRITTPNIVKETGIPQPTVHRITENLNLLNLADKKTIKAKGNPWAWKLTSDIKEFMETTGLKYELGKFDVSKEKVPF